MVRGQQTQKMSQELEVKTFDQVMNTAPTEVPIDEMPLESLRDYRLYNERAVKENKRLRSNKYPIKQCPIELHPKQRVRVANNNDTLHPIPVYLSNHLIHFDEKLTPGKEYDLPECIVAYLSDKGNPEWAWVNIGPNGEKETRMIGKKPRFSITTVYTGIY
jgi:hypothetical protein